MNQRPYGTPEDLKRLQDFNAAAIAKTNGCGFLHPGDIPHRLFNGNKYFNPAEVMTIWEDQQGIAAWLLIGPRHKSYDAQVRPDLRGGDFEREVLTYADQQTIELMRRYNIQAHQFHADAYQCDTARATLLLELGWQLEAQASYMLTRAKLENIDDPVLPDGYKIRAVKGPQEAAAVAEVHLAAFPGAGWTPSLYRQVMVSPGYAPEREYVVVAPDGTFAAFTLTWHDPFNQTGYFEPVGTHHRYRRRGLGRAVVLYGMHQMVAARMKFATVAHFSNNTAAKELYKACGFKLWHQMDDYVKPVPA